MIQEAVAPPLSGRQRLALGIRLALRHAREYLWFDSRVFQHLCAAIGVAVGALWQLTGRRYRAFRLLSSIHRADWSQSADRYVERRVRDEVSRALGGMPSTVLSEHVLSLTPTAGTQKFFDNPERLLGARIIILKSPAPREKGIVLIDYSFAFPVVAKFFDLARIAERYHVVIEPSWSGYCDLDVLCYAPYGFPVFVEAFEPRDAAVLRTVSTNLIPVATSANWWVDHRLIRPLPDVPKDRDLVMIASWSAFKRHARFFAALRTLRRRGHRLSVTLIGYPIDCQLTDIAREAEYYGIRDQVELFEWLSPEEVNVHLNRAKVNVIWSRREGVNRVIIEGMFANVPCILREGFNYGYAYPYVNEATGRFANDDTLPDVILELLGSYEQYSPREWVMANMSCQKATDILAAAVREVALGAGENWTTEPAVKVCYLNNMRYWDDADTERFAEDYRFLRSTVRR
jgi:glycosyltransferase involved in cell wall biosynthesis